MKNWLVPFLMPPRTLLESLGPKLPCNNLVDGYPMRRTYHFRQFFKIIFFKKFKSLSFSLQNHSKWLSERLKMKKSPPPYTCCDKNRFTRRTATPFVSADTHGPKDVFESKFWILKSFQKFFRALQVHPSRFQESNFWYFRSDFHEISWKSWKNRFLRTSKWWKIDWCRFWCHHAPRWKALDLSYPATT